MKSLQKVKKYTNLSVFMGKMLKKLRKSANFFVRSFFLCIFASNFSIQLLIE